MERRSSHQDEPLQHQVRRIPVEAPHRRPRPPLLRCDQRTSPERKENREQGRDGAMVKMSERKKITGGEEDGQIVQETVNLFAMPSHDDRDATRLCVTQRDACVLEDGM
jgi:hypothetical protein